ncbi:MAG: hypothetical protein ACYC7K_00475 [Desulfobacteria bacterium]
MWICDATGFFSIVNKDCGADELLVRARVYEDLKRLADKLTPPATAIIETPRADYRFRMTAKASAIAEYLASSALAIDYDNFKASLPHRTAMDRRRARAYADVWGALRQLQTSGRR